MGEGKGSCGLPNNKDYYMCILSCIGKWVIWVLTALNTKGHSWNKRLGLTFLSFGISFFLDLCKYRLSLEGDTKAIRQFKFINKKDQLVVPKTIMLRKVFKYLLMNEGVQGYRDVDFVSDFKLKKGHKPWNESFPYG